MIDVKSQASGEVLEVPVELGDKVEKGALLVRINPRDVRNAYDQAEADLEVAQARQSIADRQLARTSSLRESQVVTEDEYETSLLEAANAKASLIRGEDQSRAGGGSSQRRDRTVADQRHRRREDG